MEAEDGERPYQITALCFILCVCVRARAHAISRVRRIDLISLLQLYVVIVDCVWVCTGALERHQVGVCSPFLSEGCSMDAMAAVWHSALSESALLLLVREQRGRLHSQLFARSSAAVQREPAKALVNADASIFKRHFVSTYATGVVFSLTFSSSIEEL